MELVKYSMGDIVTGVLEVTKKDYLDIKDKYEIIERDFSLNIDTIGDDMVIGGIVPINSDVYDIYYNRPAKEDVEYWLVGKEYLNTMVDRIGGFNFSELRDLARTGVIKSMARKGWNGKGMFIVYVPGSVVTIRENSPYWNVGLRGKLKIDPHFDMYTAGKTMQPGWVCSQADMCADDWVVPRQVD